jgi:hypothetical protein
VAAKALPPYFDNVVTVNTNAFVLMFLYPLGEDVLRMDWSNEAKPFVGAARNGLIPNEPNMVAGLGACARMVRDWPPDVALPPDPEWPR